MMSSKGITPVIATVLLITITVAATASAFTFMKDVQGQFKENTEDRLNEGQREAQSDINLEYVYNSSEGYIMLNVRNTGSISMPVEEDGGKLWNIFIEGRPLGGNGTAWKYSDSDNRNSGNVMVNPQETISINTTSEFPSSGSDKMIKLSAAYENSDTHICYNSGGPSC